LEFQFKEQRTKIRARAYDVSGNRDLGARAVVFADNK